MAVTWLGKLGHVCLLITTLTSALAQTRKNIIFNFLEESKPDTLIGNVAEESGLRNEVTPEVFAGLKYQILSSDGLRISSLFTINSNTGALFTNAKIDREQVCDTSALTCQLQFDVTVKSDVLVIKILNVVVVIEDINDNAPSFPKDNLQLNISESAPIGTEMSLSGAIDKDVGLKSVITYWMNKNEVFDLREEKLLDFSILKLVLRQNLDRETRSLYNFLIYAKDGNSSSALTGTLAVTVNVLDVNDNSPQFNSTAFNFTVQETADIGTLVGVISASDKDADENGKVSYQFSSLTSSKVLQTFNLDPTSGAITVKVSLLYESLEKFQAVVEAKDQGSPARTSQAVLIINVLDVGNTPPKLFLTLADPLQQTRTVLSENLPVGSFIGTLKYLDNDDGDNGLVSCVSTSPQFVLQPLEEHGFAIEIQSALDREAQQEMIVVLKCSDMGSPSLTSSVNFTVNLLDVNDNSPVFINSPYTVHVKENVEKLANILKVSAGDADEGINGDFKFQLSVNSSNAFTIDPFTGWVSLQAPVDREVSDVIRLTVLATDLGTPPMTGSGTVLIYVDDVNDNQPEIVRNEYSVRENQNPGTFVAQIVASDKDDGINAVCKFRLITDPSGSFAVSESGVITTSKSFDRESVDHYLITVMVQDSGTPSFSSTSTLTIVVADDNDHTPQFLYPVPGNDFINISASLSPGSIIAKAVAVDGDTDQNARLLYIIVEGNPLNIFNIDNSTGTIFINKPMTESRETEYRLTISVQDGGSPRLYNDSFLFIKIDYTNVTVLSEMASMDQKYVIIAGIIAGITFIIAVIVVVIILILRRTDQARCPEAAYKSKDPPHRHSPLSKEIPELNLNGVHDFKIRSPDKEVEFPFSGQKGADTNTSFDCHQKLSGNQPSGMNLDTFFLEGRPRFTSEDIRSDTSGDTVASDSGRGTSDRSASDTEEVSPTGSPPVPYNSGMINLPRVPPRDPVAFGPPATNQHTTFGYPYPSDAAQYKNDLARANRMYGSYNDFNKPRKMPSKVRFSDDEASMDRSREIQHPVTHNPVTLNPAANQSQQAFDNKKLNSYINTQKQTPGYGVLFPPLANPSQPMRPQYLTSRDNNSQPNTIKVPLSRDAIAKHDRLQNSSSSNSKPRPPAAQNSYPLLTQHQQYTHAHHRLSTLNHSMDEEDDDGSTTTSGSYAIDERLNGSVEC
ncbi:protocadherin alpha-4-like [Physella acuta]|uniref:protocadherin alpha-4-like n=1 Tax=Physella acuta TaxID=109671 RepID=UPI0027DE21DF|nr:protocadherin alpha-4-like [Physella acuta]